MMAADTPHLDTRTVSTLLTNPFADEHVHPWLPKPSRSFDKPLLRIWDRYSGSQPSKDGRMSARAPRMPLHSRSSRCDTLSKHLNHRAWIKGPYISFTSCPSALMDLANDRTRYRGPQTLTAINPNCRIRNGLPILDVEAEMSYYNIPDPYGKNGAYYNSHYVCLWEVAPAEIINHWEWNTLANNVGWYEEIVQPAFDYHAVKMSAKDESLRVKATLDDDFLDRFDTLSIGPKKEP